MYAHKIACTSHVPVASEYGLVNWLSLLSCAKERFPILLLNPYVDIVLYAMRVTFFKSSEAPVDTLPKNTCIAYTHTERYRDKEV